MINLDDVNISQQQPAPIIRKVKKNKSTIKVLEDSTSDSSSDSLVIEPIIVENVPIERPKRRKIIHQKSSNIIKTPDTK